MKKITFIISSLNSGGAERVISLISKNLSQYYNVSIILLLNGFPRAYEIDKAVNILEFPHFKGRLMKWLKIILYLHKEMKISDTDLYISFCTIENIASLIANINTSKKIIISERNAPKVEKKGIILKILQKFLYQKCDWIVFQTDQAKSQYSKKIQKKSTVIPNPVSSNLPDWDSNHVKPVICAIGRLASQKNYPFLIKTFKLFSQKHPEYKLHVYGDGNLKNDLISLCSKLSINDKVVFKGNQKEVHEMIKDNCMYIMTSNYEGMPNSLMEAMSMGLPCISTDCPSGGPKQMIENNINGFLIEMNNTQQLLEKMEYIISSKKQVNYISTNAKKIKNIYNIENITKMWRNCISKVLQ